jgi:hypothetical protein
MPAGLRDRPLLSTTVAETSRASFSRHADKSAPSPAPAARHGESESRMDRTRFAGMGINRL